MKKTAAFDSYGALSETIAEVFRDGERSDDVPLQIRAEFNDHECHAQTNIHASKKSVEEKSLGRDLDRPRLSVEAISLGTLSGYLECKQGVTSVTNVTGRGGLGCLRPRGIDVGYFPRRIPVLL